jgi:hypothetical protein
LNELVTQLRLLSVGAWGTAKRQGHLGSHVNTGALRKRERINPGSKVSKRYLCLFTPEQEAELIKIKNMEKLLFYFTTKEIRRLAFDLSKAQAWR